jgi:hypothetical protein
VFLVRAALGPTAGTRGATARKLSVVDGVSLPKCLVLFLRQCDIADPEAHRRPRNAEDRRDLFDRIAALFTELARPTSLYRFHFSKQDSQSDGR